MKTGSGAVLSKTHLPHKLLTLLLALFLTSCLQTSMNQLASTHTSQPVVNITDTWEEPTNTAKPPIKITSTWTPVTKLLPEEAQARIQELYEMNNPSCELPCWWNVTPGKTSWEEVNNKFGQLGTIVPWDHQNEKMTTYSFLYDLPPEAGSLSSQFVAGFVVEENTIQLISISSRWVKRDFDYSLAGLLRQLGQPDEIWVRLFPESIDGIPTYDLQIFFLDKGVYIWVYGDAIIENTMMTICPQDPIGYPSSRGLFLWNLEKAGSGKEVQSVFEHLWTEGLSLKYFMLLDDLKSDIDTKAFYDIYKNPNATKCFKINAEGFYD
jgi:hypothetical protein